MHLSPLGPSTFLPVKRIRPARYFQEPCEDGRACRKSNPDALMMEAAESWPRIDAADGLDRSVTHRPNGRANTLCSGWLPKFGKYCFACRPDLRNFSQERLPGLNRQNAQNRPMRHYRSAETRPRRSQPRKSLQVRDLRDGIDGIRDFGD